MYFRFTKYEVYSNATYPKIRDGIDEDHFIFHKNIKFFFF